MTEWLIVVLLIVGTAFMVTSSVGLVRLPDFYMRMHGPAKAATLGVICVLLAGVVYFTFEQDYFSIREVLAIAFIFITAPVGAHMLTKAARHIGVKFHDQTRIEK
ncbi:MAG: Na(+)/H(+) antiporter subunit G1 [Verrucomicrobiae bacterium]|nr:Na(+)/H(+) antiporter subunit G1 [Verrucomicrobiae bacterium]